MFFCWSFTRSNSNLYSLRAGKPGSLATLLRADVLPWCVSPLLSFNRIQMSSQRANPSVSAVTWRHLPSIRLWTLKDNPLSNYWDNMMAHPLPIGSFKVFTLKSLYSSLKCSQINVSILYMYVKQTTQVKKTTSRIWGSEFSVRPLSLLKSKSRTKSLGWRCYFNNISSALWHSSSAWQNKAKQAL